MDTEWVPPPTSWAAALRPRTAAAAASTDADASADAGGR
eukprot:CAMPEP_0203818388 /NCGR_PEP_ID=MMETSP0115-20131106/31364_1 /ASSEMBLY_ACC=CAM_ASM_000227 /TAXON_ID=33651 /ORGANISM="Bicosoecid sp, Strain ms1" /LENGTH=38 /DNA_ID= /DNA_START= /DNA_END= /DNA_ORIENTATION=